MVVWGWVRVGERQPEADTHPPPPTPRKQTHPQVFQAPDHSPSSMEPVIAAVRTMALFHEVMGDGVGWGWGGGQWVMGDK